MIWTERSDVWLTGRGFTKRNRLRIYRENLIAMRDTDDDVANIHLQMQESGRRNEILASYVEGFELSDALKCLLDKEGTHTRRIAETFARRPRRCRTGDREEQSGAECNV